MKPTPLVRRILVVEDDLEAVQSMAMQIKNLGHECRFAISSRSALGIANEFHPDLVLLDMAMADGDGADMVRRLKSAAGPDQPRIVALMPVGDEAVRRRAREAGCDGACPKPVDAAMLEAIVRR